MFNFDYITNEDIKEHNPNWPEIPDYLYRILVVGGSGSGKTNALRNLINNKPDIDNIYLYAKDPYEGKNQFLIQKPLLYTRIIWMTFIKILKNTFKQ